MNWRIAIRFCAAVSWIFTNILNIKIYKYVWIENSILAFEHFHLDDCEEIEALILDQHGAEIPLERFESIVRQFMGSGSFFVNIELLNRPNNSSAQVCFSVALILCIVFILSTFINFTEIKEFFAKQRRVSADFHRIQNFKVVDEKKAKETSKWFACVHDSRSVCHSIWWTTCCCVSWHVGNFSITEGTK